MSVRALPFGRIFGLAVHGRKVFFTNGKPAQIAVIDLDELSIRYIELELQLRRVDEHHVDSAKVRAVRVMVAPQRETVARIVEEIDYPDEIPAFLDLLVDAGGNVWARRYLVESGPQVWDVIDPRGVWLGVVELPLGIDEVIQIGNDFLLAVREDRLDADEVVLYRLVK